MSTPRDRSERFESWAKGIGALLIPVVVLIGTSWTQWRLEENQISARYDELAVQILSRQMPDDKANDKQRSADGALRAFAVELLNGERPDSLPFEVEEALRTIEYPFGHGGGHADDHSGEDHASAH